MTFIGILSLVAGCLTVIAPGTQTFKTVTTGKTHGLSASSYVLLVVMGYTSTLVVFQHRLGIATFMNATSMILNLTTLTVISWKVAARLLAVTAAVLALVVVAAPAFAQQMLTTHWNEEVGFIYGVLASFAFVPQVLLTRRTRDVESISLPYLLILTTGMCLWTVFSVLIDNWSLTAWNVIFVAMILELLRLKVTGDMAARANSRQRLDSRIGPQLN